MKNGVPAVPHHVLLTNLHINNSLLMNTLVYGSTMSAIGSSCVLLSHGSSRVMLMLSHGSSRVLLSPCCVRTAILQLRHLTA